MVGDCLLELCRLLDNKRGGGGGVRTFPVKDMLFGFCCFVLFFDFTSFFFFTRCLGNNVQKELKPRVKRLCVSLLNHFR